MSLVHVLLAFIHTYHADQIHVVPIQFRSSYLHFFQFTKVLFPKWTPYQDAIFKLRPEHNYVMNGREFCHSPQSPTSDWIGHHDGHSGSGGDGGGGGGGPCSGDSHDDDGNLQFRWFGSLCVGNVCVCMFVCV